MITWDQIKVGTVFSWPNDEKIYTVISMMGQRFYIAWTDDGVSNDTYYDKEDVENWFNEYGVTVVSSPPEKDSLEQLSVEALKEEIGKLEQQLFKAKEILAAKAPKPFSLLEID